MKTIIIQYHKTDVGELILGSFQDQLCLLDFRYRKMRSAVDNQIMQGLNANLEEGRSPLLDETKRQVDSYLSGKRKEFDLPSLMVGSDFQKSVWNELLSIPFGKTTSYLELSRKLGNEKAIRAVASANGANTLALVVPCHRVIGADGSLTGYAGGLPAKKKLLELEGSMPGGQFELKL